MQYAAFLFAFGAIPAFSATIPPTVARDFEKGNITMAKISEELAKRDDSCPDATGQYSQWAYDAGTDGNGHYSGSCGSTGHDSHHCWSDIYVTQTQVQWQPFQDASPHLDCASSPTCSITKLNQIQGCTSWENTVGFEAGITSEVINVGASYSHSWGGSECTTSGDSSTCSWNNNKCHKVVATHEYVRVWGYIRRSCNSEGGVNQPKRDGDGKYTRGWLDWQADFPTGQWEYSCKYHCDTDASTRSNDLPAAGPVIAVDS